jgi:capsid protein
MLLFMTTSSFSIDVTSQGVVDRNALSNNAAYDALEPKGRRKSVNHVIVREDALLNGNKRTRLQANASDIVRNYSVAGWAIRRHLDYVARFDFHSRTKDRGLDREIETLMEIQSRPMNFDRGGRASRERAFRLAEARRVIDGDTGLLMIVDGTIQGIESDLIRNPPEPKAGDGYEWVDGVEIDYAGRPRRYAISAREGGRAYKHRRNVAAQNLILYGFWERFASEQVRGISPIVSALNPLRDVYENIDYALIKAKISQIFALAIMRKEEATALNELLPNTDAGTQDDNCETEQSKKREINLGNGPTVFDMEPDESIDVIEAKTPSIELQNFSRLVTMVALKAIDLPYSFFDEGHTNYSGTRGAWLHYERSTLTARDDQKEMRRRWTVWQYQRWIAEGWLKLPSGKTIGDMPFEWVPLGMPWWKPSEEITGDLKAIASGLDSPHRVTRERGRGDVFDNIDDLLEVIKYAHDRGNEELGEPLRLNFDPGPFAAAVTTDDQPKPNA